MKKTIKYILAAIIIIGFCGCKNGKGSGPLEHEKIFSFIPFKPLGNPADNSVYISEVSSDGDKITLGINVRGGRDVYGASLEILYDGGLLSFDTFSVNGSYLGIDPGGCTAKLYQDKPGILLLGVGKTGNVSGIDGSGRMVNVIFKALAVQEETPIGFNTTNSRLKSSDLSNPNINSTAWFGGSLNYR